MDFFRQLLCAGSKDGDCNLTEQEVPRVHDFFQHVESFYLGLVVAGLAMTVAVLLLGILHWVFVLKFISNEQIRTDLYWLVFQPPVVSLCGAVGMIIPRAAIFLYAIALVYFMICIFVLVCIMTTLSGSRREMCRRLEAKGVKLSLRVCPIGCCFFCLPKLEPSENNFRRLEWLVFQSPIIRILLEVLNIIVYMEINSRASLFFQLSNLIGIISLFVGSYGSYIIIPAGASLLKHYRFMLLFRIVDFSQLAWSVQKFVVEFLAFPRLHIFSSGDHWPATAKAQFWISFLLCAEMLAVSVLATWLFRPSQTWFFDKFRSSAIGGGRSRIGDTGFVEEGGGQGEGEAIAQQRESNHNSRSIGGKTASGLRLDQVRLNGSGHTVSTAADEANCCHQQRGRRRRERDRSKCGSAGSKRSSPVPSDELGRADWLASSQSTISALGDSPRQQQKRRETDRPPSGNRQ